MESSEASGPLKPPIRVGSRRQNFQVFILTPPLRGAEEWEKCPSPQMIVGLTPPLAR